MFSVLTGMAQALGRGADGYMAGQDQQRRQKQEDEDRAFTNDQRNQQRDQWDREKRQRNAIDAAAKDFEASMKPGETKPDTMDNRDVGAAGETQLAQPTYSAGGQQYPTMDAAQQAATASATPQARMSRIAGAMETNGNWQGGAQVRASMQAQQVGDLQLKQATRKEAQDAWDDQSKTALLKGGPDGFAKFLTDSKGDTQGGAAQFKATYSPDGKTWQIDLIGPDGKLVPRTQAFTNDARGYAEAHVLFSQGVPDMQKLQHYVAQQNADTQAGYRADQAENMREQRRLEDRKLDILAGKNAPTAPVMEPFDAKLARETAHDAVKAENKRRADANQPLLTGEEAATLTDSYVAAQRNKHNNGLVLSAAANDLSGLDPASPEYAQTYNRALGLGDAKQIAAQLKERGFQPPAPTTRPATKAETISEDMRKTGVKDAIVDINGTRRAYGNAKMADAAAKHAAAPAPAAPTASMAQAAGQPADPPQGAALDAARAARVQAQQVLAQYSLVKRSKDPQGFAAAQAQLAQAKADEAAAQQAWEAAVGQSDRAFPRMSQAVAR